MSTNLFSTLTVGGITYTLNDKTKLTKPVNDAQEGQVVTFVNNEIKWATAQGTTYTQGNGIDITDNVISIDFTKVATKSDLFSKSYNDLTDKPSIQGKTLEGDIQISYNALMDKPTLFSGSYNDLTDKPTLFSKSYNDLTDKPTLFSGSYNDLTDKPDIPNIDNMVDKNYVDSRLTEKADKDELFSKSYNDLTDKPTLFSKSYNDLTDKPSINGQELTGAITIDTSEIISKATTDSIIADITEDLWIGIEEPYALDLNAVASIPADSNVIDVILLKYNPDNAQYTRVDNIEYNINANSQHYIYSASPVTGKIIVLFTSTNDFIYVSKSDMENILGGETIVYSAGQGINITDTNIISVDTNMFASKLYVDEYLGDISTLLDEVIGDTTQ